LREVTFIRRKQPKEHVLFLLKGVLESGGGGQKGSTADFLKGDWGNMSREE